MTINRIWHGWTTVENADIYQALLHREVFPGIEAKGIRGYRGITLLRRHLAEEVEFVTIMTFDSIEDVIAFQGEDYEQCYVPAAAQAVLNRWDDRSAHYEIIETRSVGYMRGTGVPIDGRIPAGATAAPQRNEV